MPGRGLFDSIIIHGRMVLHLFTSADTNTTGVADGTWHPWDDATAEITRVQVWSRSLQKWTELGALGEVPGRTVTTTPITLTGSDQVLICDATAAAITVNLPAAATFDGKIYSIKKIDVTVNVVTVGGNGSETIDDGLTATITNQYEAIRIWSDGTQWWVI